MSNAPTLISANLPPLPTPTPTPISSSSEGSATIPVAGPFLRYDNCIQQGPSRVWRGSILCITETSTTPEPSSPTVATNNKHNRPATTPITVSCHHPPTPSLETEEPVLTVWDGDGNGNGNGDDVASPATTTIRPSLLDTIHNKWHFWRFDLQFKLSENTQRAIHYNIGTHQHHQYTFFLPAANASLHWAYFSCNGLSLSVSNDHYVCKNPNYLWKDLVAVHAAFPFHMLCGGGDQVYADAVWQKVGGLKAWTALDTLKEKLEYAWTDAMATEAAESYVDMYVAEWGDSEIAHALATIPCLFMWDDHDIFDGYGSYDNDLQGCSVFQGVFSVARRFYLLFQHHTTDAMLVRQDNGFLTMPQSNYTFEHYGYHKLVYLGPHVSMLAIDMRTNRRQDRIMPEATYTLLHHAMHSLLPPPPTLHHLIVLSGVPLIFPSLPFSEGLMGGLKSAFQVSALARCLGRSTGIMDRFDQPELMDDLLDGWMANKHKKERLEFIRMLQGVAVERGVRVTVVSGDAHVGGVGRLYSRPKIRNVHKDPLFMTQIISSAIKNAPPPQGAVKMLLRTNVSTVVDECTRQKMVRTFWPRHPRTDKLVVLRNWCDVCVNDARSYCQPMNPADPEYGGVRFSLRVEDPKKWYGYAEEVYDIVVPRLLVVDG